MTETTQHQLTTQHPFTEKYLSERQAAEKLGLTSSCLQAWRLRGVGPRFVKISARCVRYKESEIDNWAAARERTSTSDPDPDAKPRKSAHKGK